MDISNKRDLQNYLNSVKADKEGILLVDLRNFFGFTSSDKKQSADDQCFADKNFTVLKNTAATDTEFLLENGSPDSVDADDSVDAEAIVETATFRALLKGNILAFYDITSNELRHVLITERSAVQFCEPVPSLPYAFSIICAAESSADRGTADGIFKFSAFSEQDRSDWVQALTSSGHSSCEILSARLSMLSEALDQRLLGPESNNMNSFTAGVKIVNRSSNVADDPVADLDQRQREAFNALYDNVLMKKLKIETGRGVLRCRDYLAEPKLTFQLPIQLIRIFKESLLLLRDYLAPEPNNTHLKHSTNQQQARRQSDSFNYSTQRYFFPPNSKMDSIRRSHVTRLNESIDRYEACERYLVGYHGPSYKASVLKDDQNLRFVATNLHTQRFTVEETADLGQEVGGATKTASTNQKSIYDFVTCGAFTDYAAGYALGGVRKINEKLHKKLFGSGAEQQQENKAFRVDWSQVTCKLKTLKKVQSDLEKSRHNLNAKKWIDMKIDKIEEMMVEINQVRQKLKEIADNESSYLPDVLDHVINENFNSSRSSKSMTSSIHVVLLESLESQANDLDAEFACLSTKIDNLSILANQKPHFSGQISQTNGSSAAESSGNNQDYWRSSLYQTTLNVLNRLDKLSQTILNAILYDFLQILHAQDAIGLYYTLLDRRHVTFSQALTAACNCLLHKLWLNEHRDENDGGGGGGNDDSDWSTKLASMTSSWRDCGALLVVHSFLSCYQDEKGMIEDLSEALQFLHQNCKFRLARSFQNVRSTCQPLVDGYGYADLKITLPVPAHLLDSTADQSSLREGAWFRLNTVFITIGINYEETIASTMGQTHLEFELNESAYRSYKNHVTRMSAHEFLQPAHYSVQINRFLDDLHNHVTTGRTSKNIDLFRTSTKLCRLLNGCQILCCKSGKDRTAMGVTLEQAQLLLDRHHVPADRTQTLLDQIRREGTRLENTEKNVGLKRYAFTAIQYNFLPLLYRPPKGTYGKSQT